MKKVFKRVFASLMVSVMLLSFAPFADLVGLDFGLKAEAASYKTGDIITFGMYPQSKVSNITLKAALGEITPDSNGDVILSGVRYRRYVSSNITNFYRYDPIEWRVLSTGYDGIYVMAEKILDCQPYHKTYTDITWADCTLRTWLNTTFYNTAFSNTEKANIRTATLINDKNPAYGTNGGIDTSDKVFVPSYYDVISSEYGFLSSDSAKDASRQAQVTGYAESRGADVDTSSSYYGNGIWWLRTPGWQSSNAGFVGVNSGVNHSGNYVNDYDNGVRPALKLNLQSSIYQSKESSNYQIRVADDTTGKPIGGATVKFGGVTYTTSSAGIVSISTTSSTSSTAAVEISKDGYAKLTVRLYELNPYATNMLSLSNESNPVSMALADVYLNSDEIKGPTVSILGKTFPLFSFSGGVSIPLSDMTKLNVSTDNDTKNKTVKYIVGVKPGYSLDTDAKRSEDYKDFKEFYKLAVGGSNQNALNKYNSLRSKLKDEDGSLGFSCGIQFAGYLEFSYATGNMVLKEGGIVVTAEAAVSTDVPFWGVCYATFKLGGEIEGKLSVSQTSNGVLGVSASIGVSVKPTIAAGLKVVSKDLASIEAGINGKITGKVKIPASTLKNALELTLSANCYVKAKTLWLFEKKWSTNFPALELFPNTGQFQTNSFGESVLIDEDGNIITIEENDLELIDRSYLEDLTFDTSSLTAEGLNDTSVYPYGYPQLVELDDGRVVALFVYDDGTKSDINRTTLYYSVYSNGSWGKALPVCNSGLADFPVEVCSDGEKVYAVWLRASEVYDDAYETDDIVDKTELVYAEFDGSVWSTPVTVDTAEKYQMMYSVAEDNGNVTVAWAENSLNSYTLEEGTTSILYKTLSGGEWSAEETVCTEEGITGLEVGYTGDMLNIIYAVDADADVTTTGDSELYINGSQLTSNDVDEGEISYQNGAFYWVQDGELYTYNPLSGLCTSTGLALESDYRIITNGETTAVTYLESDGFTNELMTSYLVNGEYTTPVQLTDYGKHISYYDAILNDDGTVSLLADIENLSGDVEAYPYTTTDMVCDIISGVTDLEIADVTYDGVVTRNGDVSFNGAVTNKGTMAVDGYTIKFKNAAGNVIRSEDVYDTINPGETKEFSISYFLPSDFVKQTITAEIVADEEDIKSNNVSKFTLGYADIEIINATITESGVLTATVVNNGYETAQNVKISVTSLADNDTLVTTLSADSIGIGETKEITYQIPDEYLEFASAYVVNKFKLEATTDTEEESIGNNDVDVIYAPIAVESISLNTSTLSLEHGQTSQLVATVYPSNAYNKKVHWISDSIDVATVDENGNITTVGTGTAIITAISDDGGLVAQCEVKVNVAVSSVDISQKIAEMVSGQTLTLTADITPTGATNQNVTWTSSDASVATVSSVGVVYALKSGETTITVKTEDGGFKASCLITVTTPVTGITISETSAKMYLDGTKQLTAKVTPSTADNQSIIWSSSDDYVVSVDSNGLLTAVGVGTATITATSVDGVYKKTCTVTVGKHVSNVLLSDSSLIVNVGASKQLTATVLPLNATDKSVEWISTSSSIASVDENGVVTANAPGNATIIVSTNDGGFYATCDVFVCSSVTGFSLASNIENIKPNATVQMKPIFEPADAENQNIIWTTSDNSIATVDENGLVTGKSIGTAVIIATTEDGGYRDYCMIRVLGLISNENTNAVVADGYVYGIDSGVSSLDSFVTMSDSVCEIEYVTTDSGFGTGTVANLVADGKLIESYTVLIFGDVNGDGWYDGMDAVLVSCLANGLLTKDDVSEAVYMAADCNHDGVINQLDVDLLNQAGTLLANVDQSKSSEELLETSSAYVEYISLIDQSPETESDVNENPENGNEDSQESESIASNKFVVFFLDIITALKFAFDFIISIFKI